jgi:hypothetical protein
MSTKDLAHLFRWSTKVDIKNREGNVVDTLFIRLVGDVDYGQAQQYGLLESRKLRKRLRDENTVDNQALFLDLDEKTKDDLVVGILYSEMTSFRDAAVSELGDELFRIPSLPDNPTLEDREKYQEKEEKLAEEKTKKLQALMEKKSEERRIKLNELAEKENGVEELRKLFVDSSINFRCLDEYSRAFREYCVFAGTYKDSKFTEKAFDNFEQFRNASSNLKRQIIDAYLELELSGEQLKN